MSFSVSPENIPIGYQNDNFSVEIFFSEKDPIFLGHYPGNPIYPASYFVDICYKNLIFSDDNIFLKKANFYRGIVPDEKVNINFSKSKTSGDLIKVCVLCFVGEERIAELIFLQNKKQKEKSNLPDVSYEEMSPAINYLPQRYPLLVVDLIDAKSDKKKCSAIKYVSYTDYAYRKTNTVNVKKSELAYPHGPVIEGIEQSAAVLLARQWSIMDEKKTVVIGGLNGIYFYGNAYPGDTIKFHSEQQYFSENYAILSGVAMVGKSLIMKIEKIFVLIK